MTRIILLSHQDIIPSWLPTILKLIIISQFCPEFREKERAIFTALSFYDVLLICGYFVFHFYSPNFPFYLKPSKTKQKIQPWIKYTLAFTKGMRQKGQNEAHLNTGNGLMCSVRVPRPFLTRPVKSNITIKNPMLWGCILYNTLYLSNSTIVWCLINAGYWWKTHKLWDLIKPEYGLWTDTYHIST